MGADVSNGARRIVVAFVATVSLVLPFSSALPKAVGESRCVPSGRIDFNGDGNTDAVVGDLFDDRGRLVVLYGRADGRIGEGARSIVRQGTGQVSGRPEDSDEFGRALAVADLDCDGYTDAVVASKGENIGSAVDAGMVQIIWGAPDGLGNGRPSKDLTALDFGMPVETAASFGFSVDVLANDESGDPNPGYTLAVGAEGGTVSGQQYAGWVGIMTADASGVSTMAISQDSPGVPGEAGTNDGFGESVAIGYLAGDAGTVDVAVGAPGDVVGGHSRAGSATIIEDVTDRYHGAVAYSQNSKGVPGSAEYEDEFGWSIDAVRVPGTGTSWLAVGVPGEEPGKPHHLHNNFGMVQLFRTHQEGSRSVIEPKTGLSQGTKGVAGKGEEGDHFGLQVSLAALGSKESSVRLAVGAQLKHLYQGQVQLFPITHLSGETTYTSASLKLPGVLPYASKFGTAVFIMAGKGEQALLVGAPEYHSDEGDGFVAVIPLNGGHPRVWLPGVGGVPSGANYFGATLRAITS